MFIEQGIKPENGFWKYIVGTALVIVALTMGEVPLAGAAFAKLISEGKGFTVTQQEIMSALEPNMTLFLLLLSYVAGLACVFAVVRFLHKQTILEVTTARRKTDWGRVFFCFGIWGGFTIVTTAIAYYQAPADFIVNFKPMPFLILFIIGILMIPLQTSFEEYLFRGYLMQGFAVLTKYDWFPSALRKMWFPLVLTSVMFGSLHIANPEIEKMGNILLLYYIGTGFFLGIITLMDNGMELALGFHAANNLIGALLVTSDWSAFQTHSLLRDVSEPGVTFGIVVPLLVIYPVLLIIFSIKYKWSGWTEKLSGNIAVPVKIPAGNTQNTDNNDGNSTYIS